MLLRALVMHSLSLLSSIPLCGYSTLLEWISSSPVSVPLLRWAQLRFSLPLFRLRFARVLKYVGHRCDQIWGKNHSISPEKNILLLYFLSLILGFQTLRNSLLDIISPVINALFIFLTVLQFWSSY